MLCREIYPVVKRGSWCALFRTTRTAESLGLRPGSGFCLRICSKNYSSGVAGPRCGALRGFRFGSVGIARAAAHKAAPQAEGWVS